MKNNVYIENIKGKKIRIQHFSDIIFHILLLVVPAVVLLVLLAIYGEITFSEMCTVYLVIGPILLLLSVFWIISRCYGAVVCVLDEVGIHYDGGFIAYEKIQKAVCCIRVPDRSGALADNPDCSKVVIYTEKGEVSLDYAPHLLLKQLKKARPEIKTELSKLAKGYVAGCITISLAMVVVLILGTLFC